jgi:hypothetical protein
VMPCSTCDRNNGRQFAAKGVNRLLTNPDNRLSANTDNRHVVLYHFLRGFLPKSFDGVVHSSLLDVLLVRNLQ